MELSGEIYPCLNFSHSLANIGSGIEFSRRILTWSHEHYSSDTRSWIDSSSAYNFCSSIWSFFTFYSFNGSLNILSAQESSSSESSDSSTSCFSSSSSFASSLFSSRSSSRTSFSSLLCFYWTPSICSCMICSMSWAPKLAAPADCSCRDLYICRSELIKSNLTFSKCSFLYYGDRLLSLRAAKLARGSQ